MSNFKRVLALMLVLCLGLCLCACGGGDTTGSTQNNTQSTQNTTQSTQNTTQSTSDGKIDYKVTVVDPDGNPVAGAWVMICLEDLCYNPAETDANGVATFRLNEQDGYKTKLAAKLEGYAEMDYIYFEDGVTEITITLVAEG